MKVQQELIDFHCSRYFRANSVRVHDSPVDVGCESTCAHTHYCAITRVDYGDFKRCVDTAASALASNGNCLANAWKLFLVTLLLTILNSLLRQPFKNYGIALSIWNVGLFMIWRVKNIIFIAYCSWNVLEYKYSMFLYVFFKLINRCL